MAKKILLDENKQFSFHFLDANNVLEIHELANKLGLNDVDFIAELDREILFLEYKNANIKGAVKPNAMAEKILGNPEKFYNNIIKKYYDSLLLYWATGSNKEEIPIIYVLLLESPTIDMKVRKQLQAKIGKRLPVKLQHHLITRELLTKFEVMNLEEWNNSFESIQIKEVE